MKKYTITIEVVSNVDPGQEEMETLRLGLQQIAEEDGFIAVVKASMTDPVEVSNDVCTAFMVEAGVDAAKVQRILAAQ